MNVKDSFKHGKAPSNNGSNSIDKYYEKINEVISNKVPQLPTEIVNNIMDYIKLQNTTIQWNHINGYKQHLKFTKNDSTVEFQSHPPKNYNNWYEDYLIVRSQNYIEIGQRIIINSYIKSKGDEMWIGLMQENNYFVNRSLRYNSGAVTYNDRGSIHAFGNSYQPSIPSYGSKDWITFDICLSRIQSECIFKVYKNGKFIVDASNYLNGFIKNNVIDNVYFVVEVDYNDDTVYIEKTLPVLQPMT